ncbi:MULTISPECIES: chloride channel protein [unclassified Pseudodesulfovibrio]|uniref:chloride channel protein n=1 Tax=unclassified Pseudodesulfovibrio TaxID=2661612 RepID=UPI000FEB7424|nr:MULTISPECIES: chloride channel protein [unclassified Pseudodesulfovibrio]MCJ2163147.1 chloride channel protein [Pseudodesulfovibrio sp. S3-i]RWU07138.1 CBS domain-containing protein [Pseudodesulfovibrio sp. S3]
MPADRGEPLFQKLKRPNVRYLFLAILIGVLAGYGAVLFKYGLKYMQWVFYQNSSDFLTFSETIPLWMKIVMPAAGGLVVGVVVSYFASEAKGHGVPEVMQAIALRGGRIRKRVAAAKIFASAVTIGSGGSVGREGPMVQIGASIGSSVGQLFQTPSVHMKTMVGCGAAAGIAATFNAPIAGALFALEIIIGDFGVMQFSPVVLSSVTATAISRYYFGDFPHFDLPEYTIVSLWEYLFYPLLGVITGFVALAFTKTLYKFEDAFDAVRIPEWIKPAIGGALLGVIFAIFPQVFGVGYGAMNLALVNKMGFQLLAVLIVVKILASSITLGSGGSGGIFAPSLFLGCMTGGAFGFILHALLPAHTALPGAYALVAMGGVVAGTTYAPITAILIIFEMTSDYSIILPLMLTCITATVMNSTIQRASIYTTKLLRRGIDIEAGRDRHLLNHMLVKEVMDRDIVTIPKSMSLSRIIWTFKVENAPYLHVVDDQGRLTGIVSFRDIRTVLHEEGLNELLIADDLATLDPVTVTTDDTLQDALDKITDRGVSQLPVLSTGRERKLVGTLTELAINAAYNSAIVRAEIAEDHKPPMR